tara:strand:- start:207 stop:668 length:462 start_codon:yes stop_codon:yes gene_type:complete
MHDAKRMVGLCLLCAFGLVQIGKYRHYVHEALADQRAAEMLLTSDVCTDAQLRVNLRQFDKCHDAELMISVGPYQRALFRVGEDVHICGHGRCHLFYVDVTDRLTPVVLIVLLISSCVAIKLYTHVAYEKNRCAMQCFVLPTNGATHRPIKYD